MVGVAGRSKGCGTCRKRRIRCLLERPQCSNCIKSNRLCTGYQRERVFLINQTEYKGPQTARPSTSSPMKASTQSQALTVPIWKQKYKPSKTVLVKHPSLVPAHRQQLIAVWLNTTLPSPSVTGPNFTPWILHLAHMPSHTAALATAVTAISLSRLSRLSTPRDPTLQHSSLAAYTTGLWQLQKALWSPAEMYLDDTLAACQLLALYELVECPGGNHIGYVTHQDGAARLVQLRGPERHQVGFAHALFLAYRRGAILHAMKRHEPCFLGEELWLTVPWNKENKGAEEKVWDLMAQAPAIYHKVDEMQRSLPLRTLCIAVEVVEYCWKTDGELRTWYKALEDSVPGPLYWPELAKGLRVPTIANNGANGQIAYREGIGGDELNVFPVAYHFINLQIATTLLSYWSLQTLFFNGLRLLYLVLSQVPVDRKAIAALGSAAPPGLLFGIDSDCPTGCPCGGLACPDVPCIVRFDVSKLRPIDERMNVLSPVRDICQSVEYCCRPEMADTGWTGVVAPLNIALDSIKEYDWCRREANWSRGVLRSFEDKLPYLRCADY